jgi:signal transduction histidine kinase
MLAFLGGFSSATSMVIVASIALATMVSNHIVMPLWLSLRPAQAVSGDVRRIVLLSRRLSIAGIVALGYAYFRLSGGSAALAAIGLISFVGAAQILPAMLGGIFWRGATRVGAVCGLLTGAGIWAYSLYLPSFGPDAVISARLMTEGPWGIGWLRPQALFGVEGMDPLIHAMFWSLVLNATAFFTGSILTFPGPVERVQGAAFVNVFDGEVSAGGWVRGAATAEDLLILSQRILGGDEALAFFEAEARMQGKAGPLPDPTPGFGAATAHAMIAQTVGGAAVSVEDLMAVANETAQIMEYSARLEAQSEELTRTARQLQQANEKLTRLSVQKDSFLSQVSHELRTPMTSIRAFSEILMEGDMSPEMARRHATIIHDEAIRLTRLLDDLLNLSVLENAGVQLTLGLVSLQDMIDRALVTAAQTRPERRFTIHRDPGCEALYVTTDADRLTQVFINLISNARKYCAAPEPELRIAVRQRGGRVMVDVIDNGRGIPEDSQALIFEKFARLTDETRAGGAGLGLAICREVMTALGGSIAYLPGQGGTAFRVTFPLRLQAAA